MPVYDRSGGRAGRSGGCRANPSGAVAIRPTRRNPRTGRRSHPTATRRRRRAPCPDRPDGRLDACGVDHTAGRSDMSEGTTPPDTVTRSAAPPRRGGDAVDRHRRQLDGTRGTRRCSSAGRRRFTATPRRGVGDVRRRRTCHRPPGARLGRRPMVVAGRCQPITGSPGRGRSTDRPGRRGRGGRPAASAGRSPSTDWAGAARPRSAPQASFGDLTEGEASVRPLAPSVVRRPP